MWSFMPLRISVPLVYRVRVEQEITNRRDNPGRCVYNKNMRSIYTTSKQSAAAVRAFSAHPATLS